MKSIFEEDKEVKNVHRIARFAFKVLARIAVDILTLIMLVVRALLKLIISKIMPNSNRSITQLLKDYYYSFKDDYDDMDNRRD